MGRQKRVSRVKRSRKHNQNGRQGFMSNNAHLFGDRIWNGLYGCTKAIKSEGLQTKYI